MTKVTKLFFLIFSLSATLAQAQQISYSPPKTETLTIKNAKGVDVIVDIPRRSILASELALIVNTQDPQSTEAAKYYSTIHNIPTGNIIELSFPKKRIIKEVEFLLLKTSIDAALTNRPDIQAFVVTWTEPWKVEENNSSKGMSITSALTFGFDKSFFATDPFRPGTPYSTLYNNVSSQPFSDYGLRPAMMLGGADITQVKALIDRGVLSQGTFPSGRGYLVVTTDGPRSNRRYDFLKTANIWNHPGGIAMDYIDNSLGKAVNYISNKTDVLMYFTGLTTVPQITTNTFIPGAAADHMTSFGGILTGTNTQMSSLRWLEAGATASFGTVQEPYAIKEKFPNAYIFTPHYFGGETLMEAYWKSVLMPVEGIFIGDPLARPYGTQVNIDSTNKLKIKTSIFKSKKNYSLWGAMAKTDPLKLVKGDLRLTDDTLGIMSIEVPADYSYYLLKEENNLTYPVQITNDASIKILPKTDGQCIFWIDNLTPKKSYSQGIARLNKFDPNTKQTQKVMDFTTQYLDQYDLDGDFIYYIDRIPQSATAVIKRINYKTLVTETLQDFGSYPVIYHLKVDGDLLSWFDFNSGINIKNLKDQSHQALFTNNHAVSFDFDVKDHVLVWTENTQTIKMRNLDTQAEEKIYAVPVSSTEFYQDYGNLFGGGINWSDSQYINNSTNSTTGSTLQPKPLARVYNPTFWGGKIYWVQQDVSTLQFTLYQYDRQSHQIKELIKDRKLSFVPGERFFDISDNWIVWLEQAPGDTGAVIYAYYIPTQTIQRLKRGSYDQYENPNVSGSQSDYSYNLSGHRLALNIFSTMDERLDIYYQELVLNRAPEFGSMPSQYYSGPDGKIAFYAIGSDKENDPLTYDVKINSQPLAAAGATLTVGLYGDLNGDGIVNYLDLQMLIKSYGSSKGSLTYNPKCDLNNDGKVDISDYAVVAMRYSTRTLTKQFVGYFEWDLTKRPAPTTPCGSEGCWDRIVLQVNDDYHFPATEKEVDLNVIPNFNQYPDLTVAGISLSSKAVLPGKGLTVQCTVKNLGQLAAGHNQLDIYFSRSGVPGKTDVKVGTIPFDQLQAGETRNVTANIVIPSSAYAGGVYIYAVIDINNEVIEPNEINNVSSLVYMQIMTLADIAMVSLNGPSDAIAGKSIAINDSEKNVGTQTVSYSYTGYYLSKDPVITMSDTYIGYRYVYNLAPGAGNAATVNVNIPSTLVSGEYYLGAIADFTNAMAEVNEANNALVGKKINVTNSAPTTTVSAVVGH